MKNVRSIILCLRLTGLSGILIWSGSCGTDHRYNPGIPSESLPDENEPIESIEISSNSDALPAVQRDLPVNSSTDTIYTPAEDVKKVPTLSTCTSLYQIPGSANPFLAGMPAASEITYPGSKDRAPLNAPVALIPTEAQCLEAGRAIYFRVDGKIAFGDLPGQESNADGLSTKIISHTLGSVNHIANVQAPINSLIGVFLDATPTNMRLNTSPDLDFSREGRRNFKSLSPLIGQIFFIGDGKDNVGTLQAFVIPTGATRLYIAIMDEYEWNNNLGKLSVSASWLKP